MSEQLSNSPYFLFAVAFIAIGIILIITGSVALIRARVGSFTVQMLLGLLILTLGGLVGMIAVGIQGYQTLTREDIAAHITVTPIAPQRFVANFRFRDGRVAKYTIAGDEIYVDAHILKWQPIANIFGLHTDYELARVTGRYRDIEQERTGVRTVFSLNVDNPVNLFALRQRYTLLAMLLDAKYGSATFLQVTQPAELELRVSTTGLLMREVSDIPK